MLIWVAHILMIATATGESKLAQSICRDGCSRGVVDRALVDVAR